MQTTTRIHRWTANEYSRLGELGFFRGQRVELVGGRIIELAPQCDNHAVAIGLTNRELLRRYGNGYWVREQLPLRLGKWSEPEPDVSVVLGDPRDYTGNGHPKTAVLVVEVSDTTLRYDRRTKAALYAKHNIPEYWIVNLIDLCVEVHREPIRDPSHLLRYRYKSIASCAAGQSMPVPGVGDEIRVSDLLP